MTLIPHEPMAGSRPARLWAKGGGKVNQGRPLKSASLSRPNCHNPEPVTQASHERSRPKTAIPPRRRQTLRKRAEIRPAGRSGGTARSSPDGPVILYGWHTVSAALANPERQIRKLFLTENAARRLADENIDTRVPPEIVRPSADRPAARAPTPCIRACWRRPIPCPRPTSRRSPRKASCWCSTRSPIRTMSARSCARRRRLRSRRSSPPRGTARRRPACWRNPPPARWNWCRWSPCKISPAR